MNQIRSYFPIGLGLSLPGEERKDISHPVNARMDFNLQRRPLGSHEQHTLNSNDGLVPHYREEQPFPFRNSSSLPDMASSLYSGYVDESVNGDVSKHTSRIRMSHQSFDFSPQEHAAMGMDPHNYNVPEGPPGLSADNSSVSMSESSDVAVLSPLPHPLGSRLNLWHHINNTTRNASSEPNTPYYGGGQFPPPTQAPTYEPPISADDTIGTEKLKYTRKRGLRHPSLIRTPHTVCTADWEEAFNQHYKWERGLDEPDEGLLLPGLPKLPTFPDKAILIDNVPSDIWGRKQCSIEAATCIVSLCILFPPFWFMVGAGYADNLVGVVPRSAKLVSFGLGITTLCAMLIVVLCLIF